MSIKSGSYVPTSRGIPSRPIFETILQLFGPVNGKDHSQQQNFIYGG